MNQALIVYCYLAVGVGVWIWIYVNRRKNKMFCYLDFTGEMAIPDGFMAVLFIVLWPLWLCLTICATLFARGRSKEAKSQAKGVVSTDSNDHTASRQ